MDLGLRDWNQQPLCDGYYIDTQKQELCHLKKEGDGFRAYYILSGEERLLRGSFENQCFRLEKTDPRQVVTQRQKDTEKIREYLESNP